MAPYDGFISYSHAKDKPTAAALQSVIQRLGKRWYQRRALRIFRDDTSLSATPQLWTSIEQALANSRFLILLAAPESAASRWVDREVAFWLRHKGPDTLLIALTDGELAWNEQAGDFRWDDATPLPAALKGCFPAEPKWIDLRGYRNAGSTRDSRFLELAADFAAAIRGIPKEDLLSQEVAQQRRALTLAWSAATALLVLVGLATWQWTEAVTQRRQAQTQRDRAESTLGAGIHSANDFTLNVAARMRQTVGVPIDFVREVLHRARDLQEQLIKFNERDPKLQRSRAILLREMSQTLLFQGDPNDSLALALQARAIMDALPEAELNNPDVQHEFSHTYNRIGEALSRLGQPEEALQSFREALAIRRELAGGSSGTEQLLALALSHERVGDELFKLRRLEEARDEYQTSFEIRSAVVKAEPDHREALGVLAANYDRLGLILGGTSQEGYEHHRQALAIREKLAQAEPRNARWQRDLASSLDHVGSYLLKTEQRDQALVHFRRALAIRERLAAGDPKNPTWRGLLVISHVKLAEAGDEPVQNYQRALALVVDLERSGGLSDQQKGWRQEIESRLKAMTP
ncbi:MAG: tetratricopeptide repeat protein [Hyphomicrobiales bacterium]|nr:tetratricopeptide repeat protein [Hyphomicrobiales bacterium]